MSETIKQPLPVPAPSGLEHMRVMERAATYTNLAVCEMHERYGDVFAFGFGAIRFHWLVGADANQFILKDHPDKFRMGYDFLRPIGGKNALINSEDPQHIRLRRVVQPAFQKKRLDSIVAICEKHMDKCFETWQSGEEHNLYFELRHVVLDIICEALLGAETLERRPTLLKDILVMMNFANMPFLAQQFKINLPLLPWNKFLKARGRADDVLYKEIEARQNSSELKHDILAMLLEASDDDGNGLSDVEIRDQTISLVSAGFDTTSAGLAWCVFNLLDNPDTMMTLIEELGTIDDLSFDTVQQLPYLDAIVKESLRLYPPAPAGLREAKEDIIYDNYLIEKDSLVAFSIYATHRDERYFSEPLSFKPERWLKGHPEEDKPPTFAYVPFGSGARYCIGAGVATTLMKVSLITLLKQWKLSPAWQKPIVDRGNTVAPKGGLAVSVESSS